MAVLEQGLTWRSAVDVLLGALDAWAVELRSTIRGPHGVAAQAVAAYVAMLGSTYSIVAACTEVTYGRYRAAASHVLPSSRLAHTSPFAVPK